MNGKLVKKFSLLGIALIITGIGIGRCSVPSQAHAQAAGDALPDSAAATTWTCSMHPQIQQPESGDCPICGMDLIPLIDDSSSELGPRAMSMSESSRALADIQTTEIKTGYPTRELRLVGQLNYAETQEKSLTARFSARIEKLFVNYTGIPVQRGEHLAEVYSPELLTAQRELLSAYQRDPDGSITAAAREKLRLWDLLPEQIESILQNNQAQDRFELRSPINGVVVMKKVKEGDYVKTGEPLFKIVDLSELWLSLNAYESDLFWLRYGQAVEFTVEAYPGENFTGKIVFIAPELDRKTRTIPIRVNVPNPAGRLKPGMFARAIVQSRIAENGQVYAPDLAGKWISPMHPQIIKDEAGQCDVCGMDLVSAESLGYTSNAEAEAPLLIPTSAVLRTGKRAVVYVEVPNTERPTYEGREIVLGPKAGDVFLVKEGLKAGERVVTNGAFKIDSALQIQAKPSMMSIDSDRQEENGSEEQAGPFEVEAASLPDLLPHYFELQAALAGDNLADAQAALKAMMARTGHMGALPELIHHMLAAEDLDAIRRPHFETLSNAFIAAVKAHPETLTASVYRMNCSMVYPDAGADWLQPSDELLNPYFGSMMLHCGTLEEEIERQIQAQPSMLRMDNEEPAGPLEVEAASLPDLLPHYFELQAALAGDNLADAQAALKAMMARTGHMGALPELIHHMLAAEDLDAIRRPHFETLSNAFIAAVKAHPETLTASVYRMNCSMVYSDAGADWLQPSDELLNPYFGSMMLHCGTLEEKIGE